MVCFKTIYFGASAKMGLEIILFPSKKHQKHYKMIVFIKAYTKCKFGIKFTFSSLHSSFGQFQWVTDCALLEVTHDRLYLIKGNVNFTLFRPH